MGGNRKILKAKRKRNQNSVTSEEDDSKKKKTEPKKKEQQQNQNPQKGKKSVPKLFPVPSKKVRPHPSKEKSTSIKTTKDKILVSKKLSESMKCPSTSTSKREKNHCTTNNNKSSIVNKRKQTHVKDKNNQSTPSLMSSSISTIPVPSSSSTTTLSASKQMPGVGLKLKTKDFKIPKKSKSSNNVVVVSSSSTSSSIDSLKKSTGFSPPSPLSSSFSSKTSVMSSSSSKLPSKSSLSTLSSPSSIVASCNTSLTLEHASGSPTTTTTSSSTISKNEVPGIPLVEEEEEMDWEDFCIKRDELTNLWPGPGHKGPTDQVPSLEFDGDEMDIDSYEPLIIVPDTNIWIGALSLIRELLDTKFKYYAYPTIVIPWMVLQELDVQGKNYRGPSRQSIIYIHKLLSSKHPRVRGQKASDACIDVPNFDRLNADDSIIQCAQQQKQNNPSAVVILLTNDKNMMNKALVNEILGVDSKSGIQGFSQILNKESNNSSSGNMNNNNSFVTTVVPQNFNFNRILEVSNNNQTSAQFKSSQSNFSTSFGTNNTATKATTGVTFTNTATHIVQKLGQKRSRSPQPMIISSEAKKHKFPGDTQQQQQQQSEIKSFQEVLELIRQVFSYIIETKMKEDYGEAGWLNALKIQPPWTIRTATQCIIKHWLAVFCEVFGRRSSQAEKLEELLKQYEQGRTEKEEEIIEAVLGLFTSGEFAQSPLVKTDTKIRSCRQSLLTYNKKYSNHNNNSSNNNTMNMMT